MNINIPRHYLYLSLVSVLLLIFVIFFSFKILIPKGKEYRTQRIEYKQEFKEYQRYQIFYDETLSVLKELQSKNRHIIQAFDKPFNPERFEKQHKTYFSSFQISKIDKADNEEGFAVYEVNTTSKINSPANFYDFLDAINKSDWIVSINFPIEFKKDGEMINSSFTMKVYCNNKDTNSSASASAAK
ncbi:hypothetical protein [Sulfurimonas sp. C5]|uniref:hypothetical protein n=1 Tax=Sulfurimonas sp. C5 TaxID=3036947 RepID=UPI0024589736|nr:hypothetical protein [Sulfurimonas sp. C5]MDH4945205.1 hypothetical protein [Sulfurimonas sp. C5]